MIILALLIQLHMTTLIIKSDSEKKKQTYFCNLLER